MSASLPSGSGSPAAPPTPSVDPPLPAQLRVLRRSVPWAHSRGDAALGWAVRVPAALVAGIIALISIFVVRESMDALRQIGVWRFFADASWHPVGADATGTFNLVPMLAGSVLVATGDWWCWCR
jgi:ABC-type phosphate transport system permease subunit